MADIDGATNEPAKVDIAAATMLGDLRDLCMKEIKHGAMINGKGFHNWPEEQQTACVDRVVDECEWAIVRALNLLRAGDKPFVEGTVEQMTVKDVIKATIKIAPVPGASELMAHLVGGHVLIVATEVGPYMGARTKGDSHVSPDEPKLIDGEEEVDPETGEIGGEEEADSEPTAEEEAPDTDHDKGQ